MIKASDLIAAFQSYLAAGDGYIPNTSGETWTAKKQAKATSETVIKYGSQWIGHRVEDCSGAFVRAYRAHNLSIYHGSNRIAREYVVELLPLSAAKPGMMAFKLRKPSEKYYDLPSEYKQGGRRYNGDLNDYYHIGLVDDNPAYVINAQSTQTGVVRSKLTNGWDCVAWPNAVQHDEGGEPMQRQVIGGKLNLREKPDTHSNRITQIPDGAIVTVDEYGDKWCRVEYNGKQGYAVTQFLAPVDEAPAPTADDDVAKWLFTALEANEKERYALTMLQQLLTGAVG
jgi:hypothetical protein